MADSNTFEDVRDQMVGILKGSQEHFEQFFGGKSKRPYGTVAVTGQKLRQWWDEQPAVQKMQWWEQASEEDRAEVRKVTAGSVQGQWG